MSITATSLKTSEALIAGLRRASSDGLHALNAVADIIRLIDIQEGFDNLLAAWLNVHEQYQMANKDIPEVIARKKLMAMDEIYR
jgi:hypothetical protein